VTEHRHCPKHSPFASHPQQLILRGTKSPPNKRLFIGRPNSKRDIVAAKTAALDRLWRMRYRRPVRSGIGGKRRRGSSRSGRIGGFRVSSAIRRLAGGTGVPLPEARDLKHLNELLLAGHQEDEQWVNAAGA
jgi:hypothetical protein